VLHHKYTESNRIYRISNMENKSFNPLSSYFRQPAIYLTPPSKGRWWPPGSIDLSSNGELAIFPMSTRDEIVLRTPDALMNGQGVVDVIQSCCPAIKDAWYTPSIDLDAILIAIRIASYGSEMDFESRCTHCGHTNKHGINLGQVLAGISSSDYRNLAHYRDLKIKFRPLNYKNVNKNNINDFSEQKLIAVLNSNDLTPEAKNAELQSMITRIHQASVDTCVNSTEYIELPNGQHVDSAVFINEFYQDAASDLIDLMQEYITRYSEESKLKPYDLQCENCTKTYQVAVTFDYSSFFGKSS